MQHRKYITLVGFLLFSFFCFGQSGNVGIGVDTPQAKLHISGTTLTDSLRIPIGARGGYIFTSDSLGNGYWAPVMDVKTGASHVDAYQFVSQPEYIQIQGQYAYVATDQGDSLLVFDLSKPIQPEKIGGIQILFPHTAQGLIVHGNYAYADYGNKIFVYDISDPANPVLRSFVPVISEDNAYANGYIYAVGSFENALFTINASNPDSLYHVDTVGLGGDPYGIAVQNGKAYVVDGGSMDLKIFDLANPELPNLIGTVGLSSNPTSVQVFGDFAYISSNVSPSRIYIVDISDPTSPILAGQVDGFFSLSGTHVDEKFLHVSDLVKDSVFTFDMVIPAQPQRIGAVSVQNAPARMDVSGQYIYLLNRQPDRMEVLRVNQNNLIATGITGEVEPFDGILPGLLTIGSNDFMGHLRLNRFGVGGIHLTATDPPGLLVATDDGDELMFWEADSGEVGIGTSVPKAKFHVKDDGVSGQRTIVGVLESNTSDRPTLLFSEFPDSGIDNGMSIEYNGEGSFNNGRMHINKPGGDPIVTFQNTGHVGIGVDDAMAPLHIAGNFLVTSVPGPVDPPPVSGTGNRMMWYNDKAAFRAGSLLGANFENNWDQDSIGFFSFAGGLNTMASGNGSVAFGSGSTAYGSNAVALGSNSIAKGGASMAFGSNTNASGSISMAFGSSTSATGINSTAMGNSTTASAQNATAMGLLTTASGVESIAMGSGTKATNYATTAMGFNTEASGFQATAIGNNTRAIGSNSTAMGIQTQAKGVFSTSIGFRTISNGYAGTVIGMFNDSIVAPESFADVNPFTPLFIIGNGDTTTQRSNAMLVRKDGNVGIGIDQPQAKLHVDGEDNNGVISTIRVSNGSHSILMDGNEIDAIDTDLFLQSNTTDDVILSNGGGNVGIGTSAPLAKLTVAGQIQSTTGGMKFPDGSVQTSASTNLGWNLGGNAGTTSSKFIGTTDNKDLNFRTSNIQRMTVEADGNVGIGTIAPSARLHLNGEDNNGTTATLKVTSGSQSILMDGNEIDAITSDLLLQHNNSNDVILATGGGNVGVGTTSPEHPLHIQNNGSSGSSTIDLVLESATSKRPTILFSENGSNLDLNDGMSLEYDGAVSGNKFYINGVGGIPRLTVESFGDVGIGTTNPAQTLSVNGTAGKPGGGSWSTFSDRRMKQDIRGYHMGLKEVLQIRPVQFRYNQLSEYDTEKEHIGVIAQDLEKVAPHMVSTFEKDSEEYLQVDNSAMTYMLINAVKELADRNDQLADLVDGQHKTIIHLKQQNQTLEDRLLQVEKILVTKNPGQ